MSTMGERRVLDRTFSTDSYGENPFRPDGEISREADHIVQMIKSGQPLPDGHTEVPEPSKSPVLEEPVQEECAKEESKAVQSSSPPSSPAGAPALPHETVEVKRSTAPAPKPTTEVEHFVIKKEKERKCCVVQ